jgi:hypothetical protein
MSSTAVPNPVRHVSVARAALLLQKSPQHIRDIVARGDVAADRKPGIILVRLESLLNYIDQKSSPRQQPSVQEIPGVDLQAPGAGL